MNVVGSRRSQYRPRVSSFGSRTISRLGTTSPKDYKFESFVFFQEINYPVWWRGQRLLKWLCNIGEHDVWDCLLCVLAILGLIQVAADIETYSAPNELIDYLYNCLYAIHFTFTYYEKYTDAGNRTAKTKMIDKFVLALDVLSYAHYLHALIPWDRRLIKICCYYVRLHMPFGYIWALSGSNLTGSMIGTTFKYIFFFVVLRITFALVWISVAEIEGGPQIPLGKPHNYSEPIFVMLSSFTNHFGIKSGSETSKFINSMYTINNMFLPLGPSAQPRNDVERLVSLVIMLTGSLVVTGAAVASLALVISLYMRPEEEFRARFRLIMNEMESTLLPMQLREKVKTFYKMYWHKQKAVSETQLLPIFPPTLPSTIYTDIYFEAQQKSHILRDVSYQFLWEVSKCMATIHFIPGDIIIKRMSDKSSIIYITYGDIEMLTPEDDDTAILRMTCGTMISPCGGCPAAACDKSQVEIRAATYCTAQVLTAHNLWKIAVKYGKANGQSYIILASFDDHLEKVMRHFSRRARQPVKYKSSILQLKRNLMILKEAKDEKGNLLLARSDYFLELARTYVMRNRADSSLTDEADEVCLRPTFPCILRPDSSMLVTWDILMSIVILIVTFTHPYHLIFLEDIPLKFRFFDYLISGLFILDVYVYLSTGTKVEQGVAITFVEISMQQMKSWWFILDVLSILPFFEIIGDGRLAGINKLLRVPKVFRVLKSMEDKCVYHSNVLRFMSYTLLTVIASYIIASMQQTYMCLKLQLCAVKNFTEQPTWVNDPLDVNVANRLIYGLFWGVSVFTFTSYKIQDWYTDYWMNVVYTITLLEGCVILDIFMEAMYSATILVTSAMRKNFEETISDVKSFLITNHVDPQLRRRFITYLQLCWHTDMRDTTQIGMSESMPSLIFSPACMVASITQAYSITHKKKSIFFDLPPHVYQDIVAKQRIKYILCVPFMKYLNNEELKAISSKSRFYHTSPNEILQNTGDVGNEIFVIKKGFCENHDQEQSTSSTITQVAQKSQEGDTNRRPLRKEKYPLPEKSFNELAKTLTDNHDQEQSTSSTVTQVSQKSQEGDTNRHHELVKTLTDIFDPTTQESVCIIGKKDYFGVLECMLRIPVYYTVRAVTHVQVFSIPNKTLIKALKVPRIKDAIKYCKSQPEYVNIQSRKESFLKYMPPPPIPNLCRFPLLKKYEPDTAFIEPFTRLGFWSILRYIFPRLTIRPDGQYIYRYEVFRALCALIASMVYPSYTYMVLEYKWLSNVTLFLRCMAIFDIFQRCLVAYYDKDGILISHPSITTVHYVKGAFLIDLIACLPLEKLEHDPSNAQLFSNSIERAKINPIHQILMMNRLIQMYRVPGAMNVLSTIIEREDIILVIRAIPFFMILNNVLACLMVFSSVDIYGPSDAGPWAIIPKEDLGGSWVFHFKDRFHFNITESPSNLQLTVYSWIVYETTSTGRDLFQPSNLNLLMLLFIGMTIGTMMNTYFSVEIISMRANVRTVLAGYQENLLDISHYMKKERLNPELQKDVLEYYEYNWDHTGGIDSRNVLKLCDQITLRTDAILHLYGQTFTKCPILSTSESRLLRVVGRAVNCLHFLKDTRIFEEDDVLTYMYFVHHGIVEVGSDGQFTDNLPRGSVFGNLENVLALRSPTYIKAVTNCHILQIHSKMFYGIIIDFPKVKELLKQLRAENENYIVGDLDDTSEISSRSLQCPIDEKNVNIVSKFNFTYNIYFLSYLIIVCVISIFGETYYAFFESSFSHFVLTLQLLDMLFYVKIVVNIFLPYFVPHDVIEAIKRNRKDYLKGEFVYDLLSILPTELLWMILYFSDKVKLLRLNRIFRIITINTCLQRRPQTISTNLMLYAIISVAIWFSLFIHLNTCTFYLIGSRKEFMSTNTSWLFNEMGQPACDNHYICSYYFILTTFTHKGVGGYSIIPRQKLELFFVTILEIVSAMMYMIYVGEFSNIIQFQSFRSFSYYCKFLELQNFLGNNRVSKNLVKMVSHYSLHLWRESRGVQMPYFLETAPPCFKLKVMSAAYMHHLQNHPVFQKCEPAFLRHLVGTLRLYKYKEDMFVVKEGEITYAMYLIHNGNVIEYDEDNEETTEKFVAGDCFGLVQGLIRDTPYSYSYKTTTKAEVLTLNLDDWEHLLELFPHSRYDIYKDYPDHPYSKNPDDIEENQPQNVDLHVASDYSQLSVKMLMQIDPLGLDSASSFPSEEKPSVDIVPRNFTPSPLSLTSRASTVARENVAKNAAAQMLAATTTIWTPSPDSEPEQPEISKSIELKSVELQNTGTSEAIAIITELINRAILLVLNSNISKQQSSLVTLVEPSDTTLIEKPVSQSNSTTPIDVVASQSTVKAFIPPQGPSLAEIGTPIKLKDVMWPLDSRRLTSTEVGELKDNDLISSQNLESELDSVSIHSGKLSQGGNDETSYAPLFSYVKELVNEVSDENPDKNLQKNKDSKSPTETEITPSKPSMTKKRSVAFEDNDTIKIITETEKVKKKRRFSDIFLKPRRKSRSSISDGEAINRPSTSKQVPGDEIPLDTDVTSEKSPETLVETRPKTLVIKEAENEPELKNKSEKDNEAPTIKGDEDELIRKNKDTKHKKDGSDKKEN